MSDNCIETVSARWTPSALCESPGCHKSGLFGSGKHKANYAFRVHREAVRDVEGLQAAAKGVSNTAEMIARSATDEGLLLCPCCTAVVVAIATKNHLPLHYFNIQDVAPSGFTFTKGCLEAADSLTEDLVKSRGSVGSLAIDAREIQSIVQTHGIEAAKRFVADKIASELPAEMFGPTTKRRKITADEIMDATDVLKGMSHLPKDIKLN